LNFNCTFVLVLMLRHCITFLRTRGFSLFLPLDQHIYFHKITGFFIFGYSILHTFMHLLNFSKLFLLQRLYILPLTFITVLALFILTIGTVIIYDPNLNYEGFTVSEWLFTTDPGLFGLISGFANPTGVLLIIILFVMFICSQPFVRRGGCFEVSNENRKTVYFPKLSIIFLHFNLLLFFRYFIGLTYCTCLFSYS